MNNDLELAWASGFFDGEGSTSCTFNNGKPNARIQLSVGQKNESNDSVACTLRRFQSAIGLGKIYQKSRTGKDIHQHQYCITKRADVIDAVLRMWPYLSNTKRMQARTALHKLGVNYAGI